MCCKKHYSAVLAELSAAGVPVEREHKLYSGHTSIITSHIQYIYLIMSLFLGGTLKKAI